MRAPFEGRKDRGCEGREFRSHPRHLFRSAHSIFRGLTALRRRWWCGVSSLYFRLHAWDAKSQERAFLLSRRMYDEVMESKLPFSKRIRVSSGWIAAPSVSVEIYVSEIISFSFSEIKRFIPAVLRRDSETKFDDKLFHCAIGCKFQTSRRNASQYCISNVLEAHSYYFLTKVYFWLKFNSIPNALLFM